MKSKNLVIIQKIAHVLEILAKIAYVLCIVGGICCVVGVVTTLAVRKFPSFETSIANASSMSLTQIVVACIIGLVACIGGLIPTKFTLDYLKMEQQVGTPFTKEGAESLKTLGILYIVAPIVTSIISAILIAIFSIPDFDISSDISLGSGILMILLSFVFAYGAELEEKTKDVE